MALLDLLSRRWALRILWELRATPRSFRDLQAQCDSMSPSVLNQRLAELRQTGIVEVGAAGYRLTKQGERLLRALAPLRDWAARWATHAEETETPEKRSRRKSATRSPRDSVPPDKT